MNNVVFMKKYLDNFDLEKLNVSLSYEAFVYGVYEKKDKRENIFYSHRDFEKIKSNSSLRKIYDAYIDIFGGTGNKNVKIQIWFSKLAYQENRTSSSLPKGFYNFLQGIYKKLGNDNEKFRDFLEVFVAYHKYFNPGAK